MKQISKKIAFVLSLAVLTAFFCGCSSSDAEPSDIGEDPKEEYSVTEKSEPSDSGFIEGNGNDIENFTLEPQIMLTFKTAQDKVITVLLKEGGERKTFRVPDTFCLASEKEKVDYWVPIDPVSFRQTELKAGETLTLDYAEAKKMFGVSFKGTVIKMAGKKYEDAD